MGAAGPIPIMRATIRLRRLMQRRTYVRRASSSVAPRRGTAWLPRSSRRRAASGSNPAFCGETHLLVVYEQGTRREGETVVDGLSPSTLRDCREVDLRAGRSRVSRLAGAASAGSGDLLLFRSGPVPGDARAERAKIGAGAEAVLRERGAVGYRVEAGGGDRERCCGQSVLRGGARRGARARTRAAQLQRSAPGSRSAVGWHLGSNER